MIILTTIFILINILLAKRDSNKILANKRIDHTYNALFYLGLCTLALVPFYYNQPITGLWIFGSLLLTRKVVFDIALNLFRGLKWSYISLTTTSKIDQFENKIFLHNGTVKYIFYIILLIAVICHKYLV